YEAAEFNILLFVCVGVMTGVGGGVLRDVLAGQTPYIFVKHFYACASLIGALLTVVLIPICGITPAMLIGAAVIIILRFLAAYYRWSLPRAHDLLKKQEPNPNKEETKL
ncbi:MAG: TRIC cation channel family protein, partial [Clostridia bacterium]|nr:TRIC cation channel family protein [Clostridia bacterium]